ncbi:MAG: outer membrane protein assembly factor BamD [Bryobacteraceae bacterium]|jgi:outer membrane protein assembly factor BamD
MVRNFAILLTLAALLSSCGFKRHKYDNPISKDTKQPDKVLYDKAVNDIEHGRYEVARITLNTLINTYDQSEFLAKAKLAIADSWFREGGLHGFAQAEAEYKDFILFYPTMEEAAESQMKICQIHYKQMDKSDRDTLQAVRAEDECRQLLVQFPNSKFVPEVQQLLRNIQESLGEGEYEVGYFYHHKGSNPAAANRLQRLVDQYPLYSKADLALMDLGDSYSKMGSRFRAKSGEAYARLVREYPLSPYADEAKKRLKEMELPVPEPDPAAVARMQYDQAHRPKLSLIGKSSGFLKRGPDVSAAAKTGNPTMTTMNPTVPASVPIPAGATGFSGDVTASQVTGTSALDTQPDARTAPPAAGSPAEGATPAAPTPAAAATPSEAKPNEPLPQNANYTAKKKKKNKKQTQPPAAAATPPAPASTPATPPANQ